ncbi:hypothetical protein TNIN_319751 [Trichonephila inaurata madagascariensis]|uniref:Uncharacterized protein n=1 Tax=Trichonephila inaurata madagascariensis TaxID=2747483 RepID=A0A8X6YWE9_9ARAC|nr:hypothetical protein TNIN_319751 [Trichonephila inaurata madagascariensis]
MAHYSGGSIRTLSMHAKGKYRENFGTNRDFWWMLLALEPQMMTMLLENFFVAPVTASSITEIDEIMIRKASFGHDHHSVRTRN